MVSSKCPTEPQCAGRIRHLLHDSFVEERIYILPGDQSQGRIGADDAAILISMKDFLETTRIESLVECTVVDMERLGKSIIEGNTRRYEDLLKKVSELESTSGERAST